MITKHDLKPGVEFRFRKNDLRLNRIVSVCKSRDIYSVDISYSYERNGHKEYDSIIIDREDLDGVIYLIEKEN